MTQYPPNEPYNYGPQRKSGMATAAMILGIIGVLTAIVGIGMLLGLTGLILGIISLVTISKNPQLSGKGSAITGIIMGALSITVIPVIALLIAILLPSLGRARELANRSVCAANLRGLSQSMAVYAADNNDNYPVIAKPGGYGLAAAGSGLPQANPDATISSIYNTPNNPSVPQNMWILVLTGQVAPKQFLCKSDPAPTVPASATGGPGYLTNFNDGTGPSDFSYSYSFAYPWTSAPGTVAGKPVPAGSVGPWWKNETDAGLPLIADMAPLDGSGSGSRRASVGDARLKAANSFNHQTDGQNVAFGDSHAEFTRTANAGQMNDNIYAGSHGTPSATGRQTAGSIPDVGTGGTPGAWDICLVPAADASSGYSRK